MSSVYLIDCKFYIPLLLHLTGTLATSAATSGAGNASGTAKTGAASGATAWAACSALHLASYYIALRPQMHHALHRLLLSHTPPFKELLSHTRL